MIERPAVAALVMAVVLAAACAAQEPAPGTTEYYSSAQSCQPGTILGRSRAVPLDRAEPPGSAVADPGVHRGRGRPPYDLGYGSAPLWRSLTLSLAAHGAASGFDAWTSWQRFERNRFLADGGRFTAKSASKKAIWFAGVSAIETLVAEKWGDRHPWIVRAIRIGNYASASMLVSAGVRNLRSR